MTVACLPKKKYRGTGGGGTLETKCFDDGDPGRRFGATFKKRRPQNRGGAHSWWSLLDSNQ